MAAEVFVCEACGRVLDHVEGVGFRHTVSDYEADHPAVPIPQSEALVVVGRCDFCHVDHPAWILPAREFEALPGHVSSGAWAACDVCADLIERDQWSALLRRALSGWEERHGTPPPGLADSLRRLYRLLRKNVIGSVVPNPDRQARGGDAAKYGTGWKTNPRPSS